jgi:hypothetical protein
MNSKNIQERRNLIIDLHSEGRNQTEIAHRLKISQPTVHRDIRFERERIKNKSEKWLSEQMYFEWNACTVGLNKILRYAWNIIHDYDDLANNDMNMDTHKKLMNGLNLAKDCYETRISLLDNDSLIKEVMNQFAEEKMSVSDEADRLRLEQYESEKRRSQAVF